MQLSDKTSFETLREEEDEEDQESRGGKLRVQSSKSSLKIESIGVASSRPHSLQRETGVTYPRWLPPVTLIFASGLQLFYLFLF